MVYLIREAIEQDCYEIDRMIQELAEFEKMPDQKKITAETLLKDGGFLPGSPTKFFHAFVAFDEDTKVVVGYALYFFIYSTWEGKAIHMEV